MTSPKTTFFKTAVNSDGSFSRVTIYNTQIGNLTIQLLDASRHNGIVFIRRGIKDKHVWEVKIADGELTVYWDDKLVPPG